MQRRIMIPLLVPGIVSLASAALDTWNNIAAAKNASASPQPKVEFDGLLQKAGLAALQQLSNQTQSASAGNQIGSLTGSLWQSPEIQSALNVRGFLQQGGLRIAADGSVALMSPNGTSQNLVLSPETQAIARQLRSLLCPMNSSASVILNPAPPASAQQGLTQGAALQAM